MPTGSLTTISALDAGNASRDIKTLLNGSTYQVVYAVENINTLSTANSSTSVLGSGATFTGTSEEVKDYAEIQVNVFASHASGTDGLSLQQSSDGTNWDIVDAYTVPAMSAGQGKVYSVQTGARYFRIVYTNGGTLQTSFRLQTIFKTVASKPSSQRPSDGLSNENDFIQASSFNSVWNGSTWDRQKGTASGGIALVAQNFVTCSTDITRPADTTAYAANDALSDSTSAPTSGGFTLTGAARVSGGSGIITDVIVASSNNAATVLQGEVWIFDTSVTNVNDNAAFAISDAEVKTLVAKVPFVMVQDTNNSAVHVQNLSIGFTCSGSANLRFLIKVKNAYTPASAEVITVRAKIIQVN